MSYRTTHSRIFQVPADENPVVTIVQVLEDVYDLNPMDLPPLGSLINTDAIEVFPQDGSGEMSLHLTFHGHAFTLYDDGRLVLKD